MDIEVRRLGPGDEDAVHAARALFDAAPQPDATTRRFLAEPANHLLDRLRRGRHARRASSPASSSRTPTRAPRCSSTSSASTSRRAGAAWAARSCEALAARRARGRAATTCGCSPTPTTPRRRRPTRGRVGGSRRGRCCWSGCSERLAVCRGALAALRGALLPHRGGREERPADRGARRRPQARAIGGAIRRPDGSSRRRRTSASSPRADCTFARSLQVPPVGRRLTQGAAGSPRAGASRRPTGLSSDNVPSSAATRSARPRRPEPRVDVGAADAVVGDVDRHAAVGAADRDRGLGGLGVLGDVGQRLGDDEVGGALHRAGQALLGDRPPPSPARARARRAPAAPARGRGR